ncbi:MAG: hypothetical protein KBF21_03090 [Thermoanaerobaculia bacterium]|nr:hypothetical protein [Thermoanaerobaculia bacterium]
MSRFLPLLGFLLFFSLSLGLSARGGAATEPVRPPPVMVEAPPALAATAREIERLAPESIAAAAALVGGDTSALLAELQPITVVLVPEGSAAARAAAPWIAGYALNGRGPGQIVLFPARADRYPDFGLGAVLRHELTHLFVDRAAGGRDVPRWFNEGLAMAVGREPGLGDRARVALAVIDDASLPIARLDAAFSGGEAQVHSAYALAGDLVRELLQRHGRDCAARILAGVARGERFRDAFFAVTGERLTEFETGYWEHRTFIDRWVPVISSSVLLWGGISLLALAAIRRRRARDAERLARWGVEEGELANPFGELPEEAPEVEAEIDAGPAAEGAPDDWPPRKPDPKAWRRR